MKHFVFVLGSYHPNYSAVGICVKNIVDEISQRNKVSVVCFKNSYAQLDEQIIDNNKTYRVSSKINTLKIKIEYLLKSSNRFKKILYVSILTLIRLYRYIDAIASKENFQKDIVNAFLYKLSELNQNEEIDVVVPCSFPVESVLASAEFCEKNDKIMIPYLFDNYLESNKLHRLNWNKKIKYKNHIELLRVVFSQSKHILAMHSLKRSFVNNYSNFSTKITYVEHPLLKKIDKITQKWDEIEDSISNLTYTGSFLKNHVEPNYFFKLFSFKKNIDFKINLYTRGDCDDLINAFTSSNPKKNINHGSVSFETALSAIVNSDFLISVAEISGKQVSSKIFTYMSAGKPIIHFYTNEEDINKHILKNYPLSLCVKQDLNLLEDNVLIVNDFIKKTKGEYIVFEELSNIYFEALPSYTSNILEKLSYDIQ